MKKLLTLLITTLVVLTLITGCSGTDSNANSNESEEANGTEVNISQGSPPTPGPDSLVPSSAGFLEERYQLGEIILAPGETFSVSLADYAEKPAWQGQPEIINAGVVEQVDYRSYQVDSTLWQTWTFQAVEQGACRVDFKTDGYGYDVDEWTYIVSVEVMLPSVEILSVEFNTVEPIYEEILTAQLGGRVYQRLFYRTNGWSGDLEGTVELESELQFDTHTGRWIITTEDCTFTGTVNGKSGTLDCLGFSWGQYDLYAKPTETSVQYLVYIIIGGTDELSNLRGTFYREQTAVPVEPATDPPTYEMVGPWSGTIWFLD